MNSTFTPYTVMETVNTVSIMAFSYRRLDPNVENDGQLIVEYALGFTTEDGHFRPSTNPLHRRRIELINIGEDKRLQKFLMESGESGAADLHQFDYHDLIRLVAADTQEVFGLDITNIK